MQLHHNNSHCAGRWNRYGSNAWKCDRCGAVVFFSADAMYAIAQDNFLASRLRELEQDGRRLLDQGGHW